MDYVLGFLFSPDKKRVVLIEKQKPEWQKGLLNGIGGKIEENEDSLTAMNREFKEETDYEFTNWKSIGVIANELNWTVYCYKGFGDVDRVKTTEKEIVYIVNVSDLKELKVIPNLQWLIPLALDSDEIVMAINYVNEI